MFRYFLCLMGLALALPILVLTALAFILPITISGAGYLLGYTIAVTGLILAPWISKSYISIIAGVIVVVVVASTRVFQAGQGPASSLRMIALPQGKETSWINSLIDEQDSVIFGETVFHLTGGDSNNEHENVTSALFGTYSEMRREGVLPSPFVSTYLGLQGPDRFDAIIIERETNAQPKFGVIFLHGYMGNVTAQCWEIAQAVKQPGGLTVCPSTGWKGEWWQPQGQTILRTTFDYVRAQGIQRIYLGGYSNGGFGMGRLASQLKNEKGLSGLFFIDGFADSAGIRAIDLPVLIIQGAQDERVPVMQARQFAAEIGEPGTYIELNADHFLIMKHPDLIQHSIAIWLKKQETDK